MPRAIKAVVIILTNMFLLSSKSMAKKTLQSQIEEHLTERFCKEVNVHFTFVLGCIVSQGSVEAQNSYDREEVKVTPWFDDYYFYIKITVVLDARKSMRPFVTVSFFQKSGGVIKQLFRAEWDSYPKSSGYGHPQPHWHFTAQLSDKNSFSDLDKEEEEGIFDELAGNSKSIKLDRMHFAMAGGWHSDGNMFGEAGANALVDWLIYLFIHVREELKYKDRTKEQE